MLVDEDDDSEVKDFKRLDDVLARQEGAASDRSDLFQALYLEDILCEQAVNPFCVRLKEEMEGGRMRAFTTEAQDFEGTLCRTSAEFVKVIIPQSVKERILGLKHYAKASGLLESCTKL